MAERSGNNMNTPNKGKKHRKSKGELITRLVIYIACIAVLCGGFWYYVQQKQAKEAAQLALAEAEEKAKATETPVRTPVPTVTPEPPKELTDEEQIENCFKNLDELTGEVEFESIGGYVPSEETVYELRQLLHEFQDHGFNMGIVMFDIKSGKGIAYNPKQEFYSASSVKGPYMASLIANEKNVMDEWGDVITEIAHSSDNSCYNMLFREFGEYYYNDWCDQAQASAYMYNGYQYTYYSAEGLARLWLMNYKLFTTDPDVGEIAGRLFEAPEYSLIHKALYPVYKTRSKSGWINTGEVSAIDSGIIYAGDHPYLMTILSDFGGDIERFTPYAYELEKIHQDIVKQEGTSVANIVRENLLS